MTVHPAYIRDEICEAVPEKTGRPLEVKRFYEWLEACLIPAPKAFYSLRDLKKFVFVAFYLNVDRNFTNAREALKADIAGNGWKYQPTTDLDTFISATPLAEVSRRRLERRGPARRSSEPKLRRIDHVEAAAA